MATVYIKPGTGSGSGTLAAPYFQSEINTAEAAAGNNGIIYFVDGTYTLSNETWDAEVDNITYKSLNKNGAILTSTAPITLRLGYSSTTENVIFEDFNISGYIGFILNSNVTMKGITQADTAAFTPHFGFFYKLTSGSTFIVSNSSFSFKRLDATQYFFRDCTNTTVTRCTFQWSVSGVGANKLQSTGTHPTVNNSIIASDLDSAVNSNAMTVANYTNCCIFNMDHTSGGTDNIFSDPLLVDPANDNLRLRPNSPCIGAGGIKHSSSNPAGVCIQPGSGTGGSGTFENPYYMAELDTAETEAAAGNGIIYFVDGYYEISTSLDLYADGITYKSLNKHKAILGSSDTSITSAKQINVGGKQNMTSLDVGNITLEDFHIKNTRFQQVSNSASRPNKIKGLKVEDTHPIGHSTDGFLWNGGGKFIIESCFIYVNFGLESSYHLTRDTSADEILNSTLIINFSQTSNHVTFVPFGSIKNSIIYATTTEIPESGFHTLTKNSKNCCFYNIGSNITYLGENTYQGDPKFVDPNSKDFRLRANSPLIGGTSQSKYPVDAIWMQPGSGHGSGTEDDPYYWAEYSTAFLAATQSSSKQLIFKDGTYIWTDPILQDDNVGNNITMVAENLHQAIFTDQGGRIDSAAKNPTLRFKNIKLLALDHFTHTPECHYVFDSIHLLCSKPTGSLSVTASGCIFEVATGENTYIFNNSGPVDIANCIFVDHNDRPPIDTYLTDANSGTIKNTIFYAKRLRASCIKPSAIAVLTNCASENITNPEDGILFNQNLGFLDVENKNYSLRPLSPLIGKGA